MNAIALENGLLTECDALTIQDLLELHGVEDELLRILLACMFAELNRGSLCLKIPSAAYIAVLEDILASPSPCGRGQGEGDATGHTRAIQERLQAEAWHDLIGAPGEFTPLIRVPEAAGGAQYLYFQRYYEYERRVREQITARINAPPAAIPIGAACAAVQEIVVQASSLRQRGLTPPAGRRPRLAGSLEIGCPSPLALASAQKAALALAIRQRFLIISGGPGTGKTTSVVSILRCLARLDCRPERIFLAAPTGRAAYRLTRALRGSLRAVQETAGTLPEVDKALLGLEARTIHRLLQYSPSRHEFAHHAGNPLQADVVVIDEVSMVDAGLMASLLDAVPPAARLIFLGDKDQLPSVEAGAILADLIPAAIAPRCSQEAAQWVRSVAQVPWPPPVGTDTSFRQFGNGPSVPTDRGEPLDHVVVFTENYRAAETDIADVVKCLTGPPNRKAIEGKLLAPESQSKGYHFVELTFELASREHWSAFLQNWARQHYFAPVRSEASGERIGCGATLRVAGRSGESSYKDLLDQAATQADFLRPGGIAPELAADILQCVRDAQILTVLRNGRFGCTGINALLIQYLGPRLDSRAAHDYFSGLPIIITRNNYALELFNGDIGVVLRDKNGLYRALFERQQMSAGLECFALDQLPPWEPALAITVHKSQGSEYAEVLLVVPPDTPAPGGRGQGEGGTVDELPAQRLLTAEILYTGLTRAKNSVLLCGTKSALLLAAMRRVERTSGLATTSHFHHEEHL